MRKYFIPVCLGTLALALCCCSSANQFDKSTVTELDLNRYLGKWYEIARYDHRFERGMHHCTAEYTLMDDGTIRVINRGIKDGKATESKGKAKTTTTPGLLRVSFWGPFYSDYRILMLDQDYTYALVGSGTMGYLWILSRTPTLPQQTLFRIYTEASRRGYDTANLIMVEQDEKKNEY